MSSGLKHLSSSRICFRSSFLIRNLNATNGGCLFGGEFLSKRNVVVPLPQTEYLLKNDRPLPGRSISLGPGSAAQATGHPPPRCRRRSAGPAAPRTPNPWVLSCLLQRPPCKKLTTFWGGFVENPFLGLKFGVTLLWMDEIRSHHFESIQNHCLLVFTGESYSRSSQVVQDNQNRWVSPDGSQKPIGFTKS